MYIASTFQFFFYDKIGYYHIYSSYLSCSDTFATTIINIWPLKRKKGASEGGVMPPSQEAFAICDLNMLNFRPYSSLNMLNTLNVYVNYIIWGVVRSLA